MKRIWFTIAVILALVTGGRAQQTDIRVNGVTKIRVKPDSIKSYVPHYFDGGIMAPTIWHPTLSGDVKVDSSQIRIHTPDKARYHTIAAVATAFSPVWSLPTMNGGTFSMHDVNASFGLGSVGYYNASGRVVEIPAGTENYVLKMTGGVPAWRSDSVGAGGSGLTSLNGLTAGTQTFAVGTAGTDFGISSVTSTHTFNLPTASAANRGALSSADWSTFNSKEPAITSGTTSQYWRGDKSMQTLNQAAVAGLTTADNVTFATANLSGGTNSLTAPEIRGATSISGNLTLKSTTHATKGKINFGAAATSYYDEVADNLTVGSLSANTALYADAAKVITSLATVSNTELGYLDGGINLASGSSEITGTLSAGNGGTGNAFTAFTGPTTSTKTFTLPNASATVLTSNAAVTVAQGGTGLATLTSNNLLIGAGTGNVTFIAPGTNGNVLMSNGTVFQSVARKDTIIKAFGFYNVSAADSGLILEVPAGSASWTVRNIRAVRTGGTAATINIRNVTDAVGIIDNYATTTTIADADATINNPTLSAGDLLRVELLSITGTVQEIFIQMIIERPL